MCFGLHMKGQCCHSSRSCFLGKGNMMISWMCFYVILQVQ